MFYINRSIDWLEYYRKLTLKFINIIIYIKHINNNNNIGLYKRYLKKIKISVYRNTHQNPQTLLSVGYF